MPIKANNQPDEAKGPDSGVSATYIHRACVATGPGLKVKTKLCACTEGPNKHFHPHRRPYHLPFISASQESHSQNTKQTSAIQNSIQQSRPRETLTNIKWDLPRDFRNLDNEIIEFQKQNMSLCALLKFLEKDKLLKKHIEKFNKDLIYKKDITFIRDKMAFNGKYAYKWPQRGGKRVGKIKAKIKIKMYIEVIMTQWREGILIQCTFYRIFNKQKFFSVFTASRQRKGPKTRI